MGETEAGAFGKKPHHTPDGIARIRAVALRTIRTPEVIAKARAAYEAKREWSEETQAQVRQWGAECLPTREIARRLGISYDTVAKRGKKYGIDLFAMQMARRAAADAVLRDQFHSAKSLDDLLPVYCAALGQNVAKIAMTRAARKLKIGARQHPVNALNRSRAEQAAARRAALAVEAQKMFDSGMSMKATVRSLRMGRDLLRWLIASGAVVKPAPKVQEKAPKPPRVRVRKPKPQAQKKPRKLPASWVRVEKPREPKPVFQTVEAWLAAGNEVKRCPTAAAYYTTAQIPPADCAALTAHYAALAAAHKKNKRRRNSL